jgi:hypothetical protein
MRQFDPSKDLGLGGSGLYFPFRLFCGQAFLGFDKRLLYGLRCRLGRFLGVVFDFRYRCLFLGGNFRRKSGYRLVGNDRFPRLRFVLWRFLDWSRFLIGLFGVSNHLNDRFGFLGFGRGRFFFLDGLRRFCFGSGGSGDFCSSAADDPGSNPALLDLFFNR